MFQPLGVFEQLQTLLHLFVSFDIVQKVFVVFLVLLLLLFVLLAALSLLNHDSFILKFLELEGPAVGFLALGQSDQNKLLEAFDIVYLFSIVEVGEIESFDDRGAGQISEVAPNFFIFPLADSGDVVVKGPAGILVESRLDLVILFAVRGVGVKNLKFSAIPTEGKHMHIIFIVIVLRTRHQDIVKALEIDESHRLRHFLAEQQLRTSSKLLGQPFRNHNQVIFAQFGEGDCECVLIGEDVRTLIVRNQLLGVFNSYRQNRTQEVDQTLCVCRILVVKVYPVVFGGNFQHFIVGSMLQNKLLDQEKGLLMLHMLSHLYHCTPCVGCKFLLTVVALHIDLHEFCHKSLLNLSFIVQFLLYGNFHLESLRVRFCPYEASFDDLCPVQSFDFFKQEREQFFGVTLARDPGRAHVAVAEAAEVDDGFLGDADGDVGFAECACGADVAESGYELYAAHGAEDGDLSFVFDLHC